MAHLLNALEDQLRRHHAANKQASDGATNEQSKAETKWDTCGLEASYLARGHARQFKALAAQVDELRSMQPRPFKGLPIGVGALIEVELEFENLYFFLMHHGGGTELETELGMITVITPESPAGRALLNRKQGDTYHMPSGLSGKILQVW